MSITAVPLHPLKKGAVTKVWIGVAVAVLLATGVAVAGTGGTIARTGTTEQFLTWHKSQPGVKTTASGLQYQVLKDAKGARPTDADVAFVMYKGSLRDGTVFDESKQPFPTAAGQTVPGFWEAVKLMPKGGKYRFWLSPELAYGAQSPAPSIPANSLLIFDIDLLDVRSIAEVQAQMQQLRGLQGGGTPGAVPDGPR